MAKDPAERFASAGELARAFALALGVPPLPGAAPVPRAAATAGAPVTPTVVSD